MKHYNSLIVGSLMAAVMVLTPLSGLLGANIAEAQTIKNRAPAITGITSPTVLGVDATGTWAVKAYDPENSSLSYSVDWGDQPLNTFMRATAPVFTQTSTFTHSFAAAGTYTVKFTVKDEAGLSSSSSVNVRVGAGSNQNTLTISDFSATSTRPTRAQLTWKTSANADSTVWYSTSSPIDMLAKPQVERRGVIKNHVINLNRLVASTTYHVVVQSRDRAGNTAISPEISFTTPPAKVDNQTPVISSIAGPSSLFTDQEGSWTLNAHDPKNSSLSYSVDWGDSPNTMRTLMAQSSEPTFVQTSTFTHTYADPGTYNVKFTVKNDAGLTTSTSTVVAVVLKTSTDTTAPRASDMVLNPSDSSISLDWVTDEPSTSKIYYSTTTPVDTSSSSTVPFIESGTLDTKHSVDIAGLATSTKYYLKIESTDEAGNVGTSDEVSTTTQSEI